MEFSQAKSGNLAALSTRVWGQTLMDKEGRLREFGGISRAEVVS